MSLLKRLEIEQKTAVMSAKTPVTKETGVRGQRKEEYLALKTKIHHRLVQEMGQADADAIDQEKLKLKVEDIVQEFISSSPHLVLKGDQQKLVAEVLAEAVGYGPIQLLLEDPTITEIMVNGPKKVYIERSGKLEPAEVSFRDDRHVQHIIEKIVTPLGRRIDESMPMVDARLPNGSRVNAVIPPLALDGPTLTIRKFFKDPLTIENLVQFGSVSQEIAVFLEACVKASLNIIVSGGTGSGKTTMLNILSSFIPEDERIVTIEDAAELQLRQEHVVRMETRPPNIEGKGAITIRDLVRNSLRMRPDRIVVGEVRSGEALDMLQAMNTGHDGSLTTGHSNGPRDMLARLETMVLMAGMDLPVRAIREQIASAVDVIVHMARLKDGSRKVTHVTEVQGMEGDVIVLQDIFCFRQGGFDQSGRLLGKFLCTGLRPRFMSRIEDAGIELPYNLFMTSLL
jgi:pilus assembly protein CpaF